MNTLYKLTDQNGNTQGNTHWEVGETLRKKPCTNPRLCTSDVFHAYTNVNLALLLNPIHANMDNPRIFECFGKIEVEDWGKVGCFELEVIKELDYPDWYLNCRTDVMIQFAILCAESVLYLYEDTFPNDTRVREAIENSKEYLNNHTQEAAYAAHAAYAARAAYAAADAAHAAADAAADAARAAVAAVAAAYAADAARAADAAADAAYAARAARAAYAEEIDFFYLADLAVQMIEEK